MHRIPEPELMDDAAQAEAYAAADFSQPNQNFVELFGAHIAADFTGHLCDMGCGPAEIPLLLAEAHPQAQITAVDGSAAMLASGAARYGQRPAWQRVQLVEALLPITTLPETTPYGGPFDAVISNSLLHHLHTPAQLWQSIAALGRPGAPVLVMDLFRPDTPEGAQAIVDVYAEGAPEVLRVDFFNSLCAAFSPGEVRAQLAEAGLQSLQVTTISDRHLLVTGRLP